MNNYVLMANFCIRDSLVVYYIKELNIGYFILVLFYIWKFQCLLCMVINLNFLNFLYFDFIVLLLYNNIVFFI